MCLRESRRRRVLHNSIVPVPNGWNKPVPDLAKTVPARIYPKNWATMRARGDEELEGEVFEPFAGCSP